MKGYCKIYESGEESGKAPQKTKGHWNLVEKDLHEWDG